MSQNPNTDDEVTQLSNESSDQEIVSKDSEISDPVQKTPDSKSALGDQETIPSSDYGSDGNDEVSKLLAQIVTLTVEKDEWKERAYRATADQKNYENQTVLTISSEKKSAKKQVVNQLASFVNTLNLSFAFAPQTEDEAVKQFISTLSSSFDKLINDLKLINIEILVPKINEAIDTGYMVVLNDANTEEELTVKQIVSLGFKIDGQLIMPANVMV